jgi:GPI ethanolamine phosphate transferase 2/3 subunit F
VGSSLRPQATMGSGETRSWYAFHFALHALYYDTMRNLRDFLQPTLFSLILTFGVPTIPLTLLALCLGAPLFPYDQIPLTFLLATHVSTLGFLPIFYTHGVSGSAWRDVAAAWLPFDEAGAWAATVGCFVGGWLGAIPIALDWDREWQKWPCTVIWGCVIGWTLGKLLTGVLRLGIGRRINLSETEGIPLDVLEEMEAERKKS